MTGTGESELPSAAVAPYLGCLVEIWLLHLACLGLIPGGHSRDTSRHPQQTISLPTCPSAAAAPQKAHKRGPFGVFSVAVSPHCPRDWAASAHSAEATTTITMVPPLLFLRKDLLFAPNPAFSALPGLNSAEQAPWVVENRRLEDWEEKESKKIR